MTQFPKLIKSLKAFTVIFIENAFVYEEDAEKTLAKYSFLPQRNQIKLLNKLRELGQNELADQLDRFNTAFAISGRNMQLELEMPAVEYFKRYLKEINASELNEGIVIDTISGAIKADSDNRIKDTFLKFGIYSSIDEANYEDLIRTIKEIEGVAILFYKAQPSEPDQPAFFQDINDTLTETQSEFCLAIIDKKLATGDADNEGKNFIKTVIVPRNEKEESKIICCLYTSQPEQVQVLETFADYFVQEIGKDSPNKYEQIAKTLARSAYAQVFNMLRKQYQRSADNALNMVLKNQKNIKYIVDHSIQEGIPGFEAIKYWFGLAHQFQFEQEELKSLQFISGLVNFFDNQHLEDHPHIGKIGPELKELNSFELFDEKVNIRFSPVAPGDIFKMGDTYYMLMGQLCDISIRDSNKRKAKLGELLKVTFVDIPISKDKLHIKVDDGRKTIIIQNFPLNDGLYTNIAIDVSTDTTEFAELEALDLVMFDHNGEAKISLGAEKQPEALQILPLNLADYYTQVQNKFEKMMVVKEAANTDLSQLLDSNVMFSALKFQSSEEGINLGFSRVARLKGRYYDSVYNNYLNNKSRIDLNLIDNSPEHASTVKLTCSFLPDNDPSHTIENANLWLAKGIYYFKKEELLLALPKEFRSLLSLYPEQILSGTHQYDLTRNDDGSYNFELKYFITNNLYQGKKAYSYKTLFNENKPITNPQFTVTGDNNTYSFLNEQGYPSIPLTLEQLKKGVTVQEKNLHLQLIDGILIRTDIEEKN